MSDEKIDHAALIAEANGLIVAFDRDDDDYNEQAMRDCLAEVVAALEAKERENPSNCNCGYGGFHETENKNCEANQ